MLREYSIPGQGSAAVVLLIVGLVLSWMAAPGWTELILMWPNRVGGIAATCGEAFRPYAPVLGNLTGVTLGYSAGASNQGPAQATKNGNSYTIKGTATGVNMANPQQLTKSFEMDVTCP